METPGSAPWAWLWGGSQARGRPKSTTPARRAHAALLEAPLLWACPVHTQPCAPAPRSPSPTLLLASRAIAGQFPHRTPPSPGGRDAVLLSLRNRKDAKTVAGRSLHVRRPGAGPRGRHCDASGAELGIGQRDGGVGPERKERAMRGGERLWRWKVSRPLRKALTGRTPSVSPEDAELKTRVREANESCFLPRKKGNWGYRRWIKEALRAGFREELTGWSCSRIYHLG